MQDTDLGRTCLCLCRCGCVLQEPEKRRSHSLWC